MATQIKPKSSGSYTTINADSTGCSLATSTGMASAPSSSHALLALHAVNVWHNCGGVGTAGERALKVADACGILLQEV